MSPTAEELMVFFITVPQLTYKIAIFYGPVKGAS
jgi:hypothetical protein